MVDIQACYFSCYCIPNPDIPDRTFAFSYSLNPRIPDFTAAAMVQRGLQVAVAFRLQWTFESRDLND